MGVTDLFGVMDLPVIAQRGFVGVTSLLDCFCGVLLDSRD